MIQTLLKQLSIAAAVLLAAGSVGYAQETHLSEELTKQLLLKCLAKRIQFTMKHGWTAALVCRAD